MHGADLSAVPSLVWGMDAKIVAASIVIMAYVILFTEKLNRAVVALLGASIMVFAGILTQADAFKGIDFNTLALLIGMMMIVGISEKTVQVHRGSAYRKLELHNAAEIARPKLLSGDPL